MQENCKTVTQRKFPRFQREFFESSESFTCIGSGEIGGKAQGLAFFNDALVSEFNHADFPGITINIPTLTVLTTELFNAFMERNNLFEIAYSNEPDYLIAHAFQKADFPVEYNGDLMTLISNVKSPLAVRSSSLLEDAMHKPFAGVYGTKMIPNNQHEISVRFKKLIEAVKFVYASTFFQEAKVYVRRAEERIENEKMAVIIQEVVGCRRGDRFYPNLSGVARSYNFYPMNRAKPEEGVVDLALGLGKTIVDGGLSWTYSPAHPRANPPYNSIGELMKQTQVRFWAVNMGKPPEYDPMKETEYMQQLELLDAEFDDTLRQVASTYNVASDRITPGTAIDGPRIVNFAPLLVLNELPLNKLVTSLLKVCERKTGAEVEIEFAVTLGTKRCLPARLGFLQVRPMVVSGGKVDVTADILEDDKALVASDTVLGNGTIDTICDVVYVKPDNFDAKYTREIASEVEAMNLRLTNEQRPYLLIGFGRWGSSEPWLGIPVNWSQISTARAIVEATLPEMNVELTQGSHFFHNLSSFQVFHFSVRHDRGRGKIRWEWLEKQKVVVETEHVRCVQLSAPLKIMVDGRSGKGVIIHG